MSDAAAKPRRIAVVSPFLDKVHGTERATVECFSLLADEYEIHLYSQSVEGLDLAKIRWHRVPKFPGPHLLSYLWWFAANHIWRWRDRLFANLTTDLTFSPGINCLNADMIYVHVVFAEFFRRVRAELALANASASRWPLLIHRQLYYRLIIWLEGIVYRRPTVALAAVSGRVANELTGYYERQSAIPTIYLGLDSVQFSPHRVDILRESARGTVGLSDADFAILLIGNDWKNKGLACLLEAVGRAQEPNLRLLIVGRDDSSSFLKTIDQLGLAGKVQFLPPRADVEFYYAAADIYAGPSLEDAFSLPPAEAMACGIPAITSREAGVSEIITHGVDGMILEDPTDSATLAQLIMELYEQPALRREMGRAAVMTAGAYTWERNASEIRDLIETVLARKDSLHNASGEAS